MRGAMSFPLPDIPTGHMLNRVPEDARNAKMMSRDVGIGRFDVPVTSR